MRLRRWLSICAGALLFLSLFLALTYCFIPDRELQALAVRALQQEGYTLRATRFGKAFPLGVAATGLEISNEHGPLFTADKATIRLVLLPLLAGRVTMNCQADIGPGRAAGEYSMGNGATRVDIKGVRLEDLPFIQAVTGARTKGILHLQGDIKAKGKGAAGDLQIEIKGANVTDVKIGGMPLPDADYTRVQGVAHAGGGMLSLGSFTLEGEGLYVRLKGDLPLTQPLDAAPLNLTLELLPKPEFMERQKFVFLLLAKYLTSPGRYAIPIRGTFGKPLIQ